MQPRPHPSPKVKPQKWRSRLVGHVALSPELIHEVPDAKAFLCAEIQARANQLIAILNDPKHADEATKLLTSGLTLLVKIEVFEEDRAPVIRPDYRAKLRG